MSAGSSFFFELTPERVLRAVEDAGLPCTGRCQALNSFENRVYDVELDLDLDLEDQRGKPSKESKSALSLSARRRVVKFYRPGRWREAQLLEEHRFIRDLIEAEIPAIAPLEFPGGGTLRKDPETGIFHAIFPRVGGRAPDELSSDQLIRLGRLLARIHNVGAGREAPNRVAIGPTSYGRVPLEFLLREDWIPLEFRERYRVAVEAICDEVEPLFSGVGQHRLHGDCHLGNLLWSPEGPFFLDFDDMVRGPAVQDLWLLIPGRDARAREQLETLLAGYEEFRVFDRASLKLIEPLRALRFVHYTAWVARRWDDPAFPQAFPQFGTHRYWSDETGDLEEQLRLIREDGIR